MLISLQAQYKPGSSSGGALLKVDETIGAFGRLLTSCWCYHTSVKGWVYWRQSAAEQLGIRVSTEGSFKMTAHSMWLITSHFRQSRWRINPIHMPNADSKNVLLCFSPGNRIFFKKKKKKKKTIWLECNFIICKPRLKPFLRRTFNRSMPFLVNGCFFLCDGKYKHERKLKPCFLIALALHWWLSEGYDGLYHWTHLYVKREGRENRGCQWFAIGCRSCSFCCKDCPAFDWLIHIDDMEEIRGETQY